MPLQSVTFRSCNNVHRIIFLVTPCINDIKHFIIQLMHTTWKRRVFKTY